MNNVIETMINKYNPQSDSEKENAIKEIIQEIALAGLSRGGFFEKAAFYGGTCLRIFHGLNRFSEDLDFALFQTEKDFKLDSYFPYINKELLSFGISMDISLKGKEDDSAVQTAFLKGNTVMLFMNFFPNNESTKKIIGNQKIKIKFEIDLDNPAGGLVETKYQLLPSPYEIKIFDETTLFSGKVHAILCREYKHHVKGRDYYDYLFYCGKNTKLNLTYLENKLKNTGKLMNDEHLTIDMVKNMLKSKFESVDYESAKKDVIPFIKDQDSLKIWSKELFISTLDRIK